jgi:hypothetical protein
VSAREIERISKIVRDYSDSTRPLSPSASRPRCRACSRRRSRSCRASRPQAGVGHLEGRARASATSSPIRAAAPDRRQSAVQRAGRRRSQRPRRVEARPVADDDILITVSDTGHGIPPDDCGASSSRSTRPRGAARAPASASPSAGS